MQSYNQQPYASRNDGSVAFRPWLVSPESEAPGTVRFSVFLSSQATPSHIGQAELFRCLGAGLLDSPPPVPQRLPLLNEAWKVFRAQKDPVLYTSCVAAYVELLVKHYSDQEVMILLRDLSRQLRRVIQESSAVVSSSKPGELPTAVMAHLEKTMVALASVVTAGESSASLDFNAIITSDAFLKLLDMFHSNRKTIVCQTFLEALIERKEPISDPEVIHTYVLCQSPPAHPALSAFLQTFST